MNTNLIGTHKIKATITNYILPNHIKVESYATNIA